MTELWEEGEGKFLFHYTAAPYAREIGEDGNFLVGHGAHFGFGLYATDLRPEDAEPEEIRAICFGGDGPEVAFDGVLVLLGDDRKMRFEAVEPGIFLLPAEDGPGQIIPLHPILVGIGQRKLGNCWKFETWP